LVLEKATARIKGGAGGALRKAMAAFVLKGGKLFTNQYTGNGRMSGK